MPLYEVAAPAKPCSITQSSSVKQAAETEALSGYYMVRIRRSWEWDHIWLNQLTLFHLYETETKQIVQSFKKNIYQHWNEWDAFPVCVKEWYCCCPLHQHNVDTVQNDFFPIPVNGRWIKNVFHPYTHIWKRKGWKGFSYWKRKGCQKSLSHSPLLSSLSLSIYIYICIL